ncbi:hypothetical protein BDV24DRAFT_164220 [Aspergillus arachidicola]|uniref:Uncharacterized protein n=1 Tax=Aspergillus arachidicola TaxID=656916 RepID=A0A5N6Y7E2_9EURO|nr:hypothetical protein BDV24DRAFT_164220 [Aspergillus arachidicola]
MAPYEIQVLDKEDFCQQYIVPLQSESQLRALAPSAVRVRTETLSLTVNNTTYAKLGSHFGWWDVHPLPAAIPKGFSNPQKYGQISAWGFARVIESNYPQLPVNSVVYGYLPIGTLPVDLQLSPSKDEKQVLEVSPHRSHVLPIYNRYLIFSASEIASSSRYSQGWSSLIRPLFQTSWMLNTFLFAGDESLLVKPSHQASSWTIQDADITSAIVILLSASGKTALTLAHQLRRARHPSLQPQKVVGVTSKRSLAFTKTTELHDEVVHYEAATPELLGDLSISSCSKVVLCDFGSRGNSFQTWVELLKPACKSLILLGIGDTPQVESQESLQNKFIQGASLGKIQVNASDLSDMAMTLIGEDRYRQRLEESWREFLETGALPGVSLEWGSGMRSVEKVWNMLCSDEIDSRKGYVIEL